MKRFLFLLGILILMCSFTPVYAVDFDVEVDWTKRFTHPQDGLDYFQGNADVFMDIKLGNESGADILGFSQTLQFYSTNGDGTPIIWRDEGGTPEGSIVRMNGWEDATYWDATNEIHTFDWDGSLPDTMNHTVIGNWPDGDPTLTRLRFHFMVPVAGHDVTTDVVEICVDQSNAPDPTYDWMFPDGSQFGGPYCFQFVGCVHMPPEIDDPDVALSTAHDVPFDRTYSLSDAEGNPVTGVSSDVGTIDFTPGDWSFDWHFDPPCEWIDDGLTHSVTFLLYDDINGHMPGSNVYTTNLIITEGGEPVISENYQSDILVGISETEEVTVELEGAGNDDEIWSYTVSDFTTGDVFFDNGYLTFTPNEDDDGTIFLFTVRATDCLGGFDEAEVYFWARSEVLCGDPNYDSEINILDAVQLINILYKWNMNPGPLEINDVDNSGAVNILDVVYIINFKYKDGPAPNCPE